MSRVLKVQACSFFLFSFFFFSNMSQAHVNCFDNLMSHVIKIHEFLLLETKKMKYT